MNANPTVPREELLAPPGSRSRRMAWLMYAGSALAVGGALALLAAALRCVVGFGGERAAELLLGGVLLLVALFFVGVAVLAFRSARERMRRRQTLYYPGF